MQRDPHNALRHGNILALNPLAPEFYI